MEETNVKLSDKEELIVNYYDDVLHYLSVFDLPEGALGDAVQDTFVEALCCLPKQKDAEKLKFWLIKIAQRVGRRYQLEYKKTQRKECSFEDYMVKSDYNPDTFCDSQLDGLIRDLDNSKIYDYVARLGRKEQQVLILHYVYGHKFREVACILGETQTNVKSIACRARQKLKSMIEEEGGIER